MIKFHIFEVFTVCSKHGKIGSGNVCDVYSKSIYVGKEPVKLLRRKLLTLKELSIGIFMKLYYLPALEKYLCIIYSMYMFFLNISVVR